MLLLFTVRAAEWSPVWETAARAFSSGVSFVNVYQLVCVIFFSFWF